MTQAVWSVLNSMRNIVFNVDSVFLRPGVSDLGSLVRPGPDGSPWEIWLSVFQMDLVKNITIESSLNTALCLCNDISWELKERTWESGKRLIVVFGILSS